MPAAILFMLVTTWIHYRRRQTLDSPLLLSIEGIGAVDDGGPVAEPHTLAGDGRVDEERSVKDGDEDYKENLYRGILWMKEKYEQYRDLADERYERLKEQLTQVEKRYEDLLESVQRRPSGIDIPAPSPVLTEEQGLADPLTAWRSQRMLDSQRLANAGPTGDAGGLADTERMAGAMHREERIIEERPVREFSGGTEVMVERADAGPDRIRIQELEEQLARTQQRFDEEVGRMRYQLEEEVAHGRRLQDEKNAFVDSCRQLEQQVLHSGRQLEEKQRMIADLEGQLTNNQQKIDELVGKLRNNTQLLMNIYQELDKSLHFSDGPVGG